MRSVDPKDLLEATGTHVTQRRKRVPIEHRGSPNFPPGGPTGYGFTTVADGEEEWEVQVVVNVRHLLMMIGDKAIHSSKGVTKLQQGAVEVRRVRKVRHRPEGGQWQEVKRA